MDKQRIAIRGYHWIHIIFSILVILSLIAGCSSPWQIEPDNASIEPVGFEERLESVPTRAPQTDLPPALVEVSPLPASSISLNQPITLFFNQAMDTASVEAAIQFNPYTSGGFNWEDAQTVTFTPDQSLVAGTRLNLALDTRAQAINQLNLPEPIMIEFQVAEPLRVVQTIPEDGAEEVDPETVVFVVFNQPVTPIGEGSMTEAGFTLEPLVMGVGEWLNSTTYKFQPETTMDGGTNYTIQINEDLLAHSSAGFSTLQKLDFNFITAHPSVIRVRPNPDEMLSLDGPVQFNFNIRMDPVSVEQNFNLFDQEGKSVTGTFSWDQDQKSFYFSPNILLDRNTRYTAWLAPGALSAGGIAIIEDVSATWKTYPAFQVDTSLEPQFESYYGGFGQYTLSFSAPLKEHLLGDTANLETLIRIEPELPGKHMFSGEKADQLWISGYFLPETTYTLIVDGGITDAWGELLGESYTTSFDTPAVPPSLGLVGSYSAYNLVFVPTSASELILQVTNIGVISLEIAPITTNDLITLLYPENIDYREMFLPQVREVTTHDLDLPSNRREVVRVPLSFRGEPLNPGVYYLGVSTPDILEDTQPAIQKYTLVVSDNNLVMKVAPDQALVWGTRLADQSPLLDAPVAVFDTEGGLLTRGRLDADGLFVDSFERVEDTHSSYFALVGEPGEADFAFTFSSWQDPYYLFDEGLNVDPLPALVDAYIYTDRPIYRPGDRVNFKAAVFLRDNGLPVGLNELRPGLDNVSVAIRGDYGLFGSSVNLYSRNLVLSQFSTVSGSATLPESAMPGTYRIEVSIEDELINVLYFDVAAYRKPDIDLYVGFSEEAVHVGEDILADVQANYFFGLPAVGQSFSWILYQVDEHFHLPGYTVGPLDDDWVSSYGQGFFPYGGEVIAAGDGKTGEDGFYSLRFTEDDLDINDGQPQKTKRYHLEVTVEDESGFPVSFHDSILVHPESFYIGVKPEAYFGHAGKNFNFSLLTVDVEKVPVGNIVIEATFESIRWLVEETGNPQRPYQYQEETGLINSASPVSNSEGRAKVSFIPPDPGTYRLTLEAGKVVTQVLIWVSGEGAVIWPTKLNNQINLVSDAEVYQPGQAAQVFIPNPLPGVAQALLTTERGRVMSSQVFSVPDTGVMVSVPITDESIPNVFVSVIILGKDMVGRPDYRQGILELQVTPNSKVLNIDLSIDPALTAPGERVRLNLKVSDPQGNPVQGEFSVVVVDKALLALATPNSLPIQEAFYKQAPLSVQTNLSLFTFARQLDLTPLDIGGLGGGAVRSIDTAIRKEFPDTAFWQAEVITAVDGTAQLSVPLPDSLTTWVVEVRGLNESFLVGQVEAEIQTQKPLMVRPVTPRFLVDGDLLELAAIVHNNTDDKLTVDVSLLANGFTLAEDNLVQRVVIEPGQNVRVTWWGTVESVETVELVFKAEAGELLDASAPVWGDLQVKRYTIPQTFSSTGQLVEPGERLELVNLPISTDPTSGELSLEVSPNLVVTIVDGLEAMERYRFQDTLSIQARLLAKLHVSQVIDSLNGNSTQESRSLAASIKEDINQLLSNQNFDGGWSWWGSWSGSWSGSSNISGLTSDPFITAYVLMGLETAQAFGQQIDQSFINRAREHLVTQIPQPEDVNSGRELEEFLFIIHALGKNDDGENLGFDLVSMIDVLYNRRAELSPWALGLLALSMREAGGMDVLTNALVAELETSATRTATSVHWESMWSSWTLPGTPVFNTAVVLYALAQLDPASSSLPLALRYLMAHHSFESPRISDFESSWVLMATAKTMQGTGDFQADYDYAVLLNGIPRIAGAAVGLETMDANGESALSVSVPIDDLYPESPNAVVIERSEGIGTLYYRVDLRTFQSASTAQAINGGISIERAYYPVGMDCPGNADCEPINSIMLDPDDPSQMVRVVLSVNLAHDMYHILVNDFIPAGTEILNRRLLTTQSIPADLPMHFDPRDPFVNGWGWWFFNPPLIYDDHIQWTADYVPAGTYILTYELLPFQRGVYQVLPAHAWQYFYPDVQGASTGEIFRIE